MASAGALLTTMYLLVASVAAAAPEFPFRLPVPAGSPVASAKPQLDDHAQFKQLFRGTFPTAARTTTLAAGDPCLEFVFGVQRTSLHSMDELVPMCSLSDKALCRQLVAGFLGAGVAEERAAKQGHDVAAYGEWCDAARSAMVPEGATQAPRAAKTHQSTTARHATTTPRTTTSHPATTTMHRATTTSKAAVPRATTTRATSLRAHKLEVHAVDASVKSAIVASRKVSRRSTTATQDAAKALTEKPSPSKGEATTTSGKTTTTTTSKAPRRWQQHAARRAFVRPSASTTTASAVAVQKATASASTPAMQAATTTTTTTSTTAWTTTTTTTTTTGKTTITSTTSKVQPSTPEGHSSEAFWEGNQVNASAASKSKASTTSFRYSVDADFVKDQDKDRRSSGHWASVVAPASATECVCVHRRGQRRCDCPPGVAPPPLSAMDSAAPPSTTTTATEMSWGGEIAYFLR